MEFNEVIVFEGGINTDDTPQAVPKGDYRDFSYCRLGYNAGNAMAVTTSSGTIVIPNLDIAIQDQILGATQWQKENSIVYFVYKADLSHEIWVYDITSQTHILAVQDNSLNFSRDWPIYHANVVDDVLKWTDGRWDNQMYEADGTRLFNPPYQINLRKALDGYYTIVDLQTIDAIKWPLDPPRISYFTDPTRNDNKLRNKLFKFIIQPIYENGELGVWSMYSNLDLPQQSELVSGTNWIFLNNSNGIKIQFNTGPEIIRKFNLAVQQFDKDAFGTEPPFAVFLQLDKDQDNIPSNSFYTVDFYGGVATTPAIDVFKNYDRLPIVADCQEYLPTNQLTYVNFREGYDKPTEAPFILDVAVDYEINEIFWNPTNVQGLFYFQYSFIGGLNVYTLDNILAATNAATFNPNAVFAFSEGMTLSFTDGNNAPINYTVTHEDIQNATALFPSIINANLSVLQVIGDSFTNQLGIPNGVAGPGLQPDSIYYSTTVGGPSGFEYRRVVSALKPTLATPSLKSGATHEFGIVYGDRAYRDSTVYTVDSMNLFVPWFYDIDRSGLTNAEDPFTINPKFTIDHIPPVWATKYWIVAKPATEILSFGQYTTNANPVQGDGGYYISSVTLDVVTNNRYKIAIDKYYVTQNLGATINHEIKIGDKIRFIRRRPGGPGPISIQYLPYLELDVIGYESSGAGVDGRQVVYTNLFDTTLIDDDPGAVGGFLFGQLIEIYTPRPSVDSTGNVFVSTWKDITESIEIINPHTENRSHGSPCEYILYVETNAIGTPQFYIQGDYTNLNNTSFNVFVYYDDNTSDSFSNVTITTSYNQVNNLTAVTIPGVVADARIWYVCLTNNVNQVVTALNSTTAAEFSLSYGDVYVRQRNYQTGLVGTGAVMYYFIEDPHYSDYWSSNIHNTGRTRVEDQNAKMTHRQATAIHSDSFIFGTQVNGLSSFALDNTNIEDMNPTFGGVVRAYMSGREGKTLKCIQPKKENSIYIQFYPNEVGSDSTVRVSNKTFASWFDYKSLLGCSNSGATAILPNGSTMYFDNNTGVFVYSGSNGQIQVSEVDPDSGKDYKFRTKTKALAKAYNESSNPMVRTYVNESVGEVGFAFRFDVPYTGAAYGAFNPPIVDTEYFRINGDVEYLYDYSIVITFSPANGGSGNVYQGTINYVQYNPAFDYTLIGIEGVLPSPDDFDVEGYYFTTSGLSYDHVVFDYVNMRWRSTYDYNFKQFCNLGQTLVGWGLNNQMYLHNQPGSWEFHGQPFIQKISFVSNENPLMLKRYQDITLVSDDTFSIEAYSEPNRSYPLGMKTSMPTNIVNIYEGYGKTYYRKNLYDPRFFNTGTSTVSNYDPMTYPVNGWLVPGDQQFLNNENITIIQSDGSIFSARVVSAVYDTVNDNTLIELFNQGPGTYGVTGYWYNSDRAMLNGEDIRANALTHDLYFDPSLADQSSVLFSVGIKGVLS